MANAGLRLSVEGERTFKSALKEIDAQIKINKAEIRLLTEEYKLNDSSVESLVSISKALSDTMETQKSKISMLETELQKAIEEHGEMDGKVLALKESLLKESAALVKITAEYKANSQAIDEAQNSTEALDDMLRKLEAGIKANEAELRTVIARYEDAENKETSLTQQNKLLNDSITQQEKKIELLNDEMKVAIERYGQESVEVSEYRVKVAEASTELVNMKKHVEQNSEALENSGDSGGKLKDVLEKVSKYTGVEIPEGITTMIGGFDAATTAAGGIATVLAGAVAKIIEMFKESLGWADELNSKSVEMDIGSEEYQAMEYAMLKLGVSMDVVQDALKEINNHAGETDKVVKDQIGTIKNFSSATVEQKNAVNEAMKEWDELGVSIYDTTTGELRPAQDIFYDLIDVYANMTNSTERAYKMNDMFGESYRKLNPLLDAGTGFIKRYVDEAYDVGYVLDDVFINKMDMAQSKLELFNAEMERAKYKIMGTSGSALFTGDFWSELWGGFARLINLPGYATGTYNHPGGYAIVGEKGPELVEIPTGSKVYPTGTFPAMSSSVINYYVTIDANRVHEFNDIIRIAQNERRSMRMGYTGG